MGSAINKYKSKFLRELGITLRGIGNVAVLMTVFFLHSAFTMGPDPSGLYNDIDETAAAISFLGGFLLRIVGNQVSRLSDRPL